MWLVARLRASADCIQPSCMECVCVCGGCRYARLMHSLVDVLCRETERHGKEQDAHSIPHFCAPRKHSCCCVNRVCSPCWGLHSSHRLFKERAAMRMRAARPNVGPRVCKFITLEVASLSVRCVGLGSQLRQRLCRASPRCVPWLQCAATPANALQDSHRHLRDLDTWLVVVCASSNW
jgi:hypothetical protein